VRPKIIGKNARRSWNRREAAINGKKGERQLVKLHEGLEHDRGMEQE